MKENWATGKSGETLPPPVPDRVLMDGKALRQLRCVVAVVHFDQVGIDPLGGHGARFSACAPLPAAESIPPSPSDGALT
jgi:hypothetical protein